MSIQRRINHHIFEGDCEQCGAPVDVGDVGYYNTDLWDSSRDQLYCSNACIKAQDDLSLSLQE